MEAIPVHRLVKGAARALHDRPIGTSALVEVLEIDRSAIVLGSTQASEVVDSERAAARGFDVVRRRSGGGVVVLARSEHVWIDVTVPRGHRLWDEDVQRATWWLGDVWCAVLAAAKNDSGWSVHREKLVASAPERVVCFASVGPGEVLHNGHKVVGISQRRTKDAARFQCTVFRRIDLELHAALLRSAVPASLSHAEGVGNVLEELVLRMPGALNAELQK